MKDKDKESTDAARFLDNLGSFLGEDDPQRQDLVEDLQASGLNPDGLARDLRQLLAQHAPTWKQKAQQERAAAIEIFSKCENTPPRTRNEMEQEILGLIQAMQQLGVSVTAGAYHQKFREATDTDLASLVQDLTAQYQTLKNKKSQ